MPNPLAAADLDHVLAHTEGVWEELRGARLFVTGGTGFFGCWLVESFLWAADRMHLGATMTVLTRSPEAFGAKAPHLAGHPALRLIQGDVRNFRFPQGPYTHIVHGAAQASAALNREQPLAMLDTIVEGTRHTLDFAAAAGATRFLLIGSGAVYGAQPPQLTHVPETYTGGPNVMDPAAAYAEGKRLAELLSSVYGRTHGLDCAMARCFAFVGPHLPLDAHFAIGNFIGDCLNGRDIRIQGDGTPYRSYLYAADLAIWLWTILARGATCRPYNTGSERAVTIEELAEATAAAIHPGTSIRLARRAEGGLPAERYVPDTGRARAELGLRERISL